MKNSVLRVANMPNKPHSRRSLHTLLNIAITGNWILEYNTAHMRANNYYTAREL